MPSLNIHPAVAALDKQIVAHRRHFHKHPELGFQEVFHLLRKVLRLPGFSWPHKSLQNMPNLLTTVIGLPHFEHFKSTEKVPSGLLKNSRVTLPSS